MPELKDAWAFLESSDLVARPEISAAIDRMAGEIQAQFKDRHPLVLVVMGGAVVFAQRRSRAADPITSTPRAMARRRRAAALTGRWRRLRTCAVARYWCWTTSSTAARPWPPSATTC
jgi:hypothetical protein